MATAQSGSDQHNQVNSEYAVVSHSFPDTILLGPDFKREEIGARCYLRSAQSFARFTVSDSNWEAGPSANISLASDKIHWISGLLKNPSKADKTLKLYLNHVQTGPVHLYVLVDGKIIDSAITGSIIPIQKRATMDRALSFVIVVPAVKTAEFYIRAERREIDMTISLLLSDMLSDKQVLWEDSVLLVALSFIFIIFLTALMAVFYLPDRKTVSFLVYILFGFLYVMAASGYGSLYWWSSLPWFEENAAAFLASISIVGLFGFSKKILRLNSKYRPLNRMLNIFMIVYPLITILGFALYFDQLKPGLYTTLMNSMYLFLFVFFLAILYVSINEAIVRKQKEYYWFVLIFGLFAIFSTVTIFFETGIMAYDYKAHVVFLIASTVPQMTLTLLFLINKLVAMLKWRTYQVAEIRAHGEKSLLNERLRISRELHDEVGATLSGVAMYSHLSRTQLQSKDYAGVGNSLHIMQASSAQMVNKLNDIVWLINPDKGSLTDLIQRLEEYAQKMTAVRSMALRVAISENIQQYPLTMEQRRNIFLFCKETINNAVKYSGGTLLTLAVKNEDGLLGFCIQDNGKGFDPLTVKQGNGLKNLQHRAEEMHATYTVHSEPGKGSSILLQVKITQ